MRLWNFYLAYCEAGFEERQVSVVQLVLNAPAEPPPWRSREGGAGRPMPDPSGRSDTANGGRFPGLMWFRRDLRLDDNPAWSAATSQHREVTALYVLDDRLLRSTGPFRRRQLVHQMHALDGSLRARGGRLLVRRGDPIAVVPAEASRLGATRVHWNADVSPYATKRDGAVISALRVGASTPFGHLVLPPGAVVTGAGSVSKVFGAFHRKWQATPWDPWPEPGDARIGNDAGQGLPAAEGEPPMMLGEEGARAALEYFIAASLDDYIAGRDRIPERATSEMSIALRFGTISPRRMVKAVDQTSDAGKTFVRQLAWRDWFAHLLAEDPTLPSHAMRPEFDSIEWRNDQDDICAWKEGKTGYPIVDAGMRELSRTGAMHNRVRMIAASFLVKDLLVDWRIGERYFRHLLADGDVSQNVGNWQWVAGTGPDAAPYFRIFNPTTQSRAHDPGGTYIRRWVPELARLDDSAIHAPWNATPATLAVAEVELGRDYPFPIVDHAGARFRTLQAYGKAKASTSARLGHA